MRKLLVITAAMVFLMFMASMAFAEAERQEQSESSAPDQAVVIFAIGSQNGSGSEFLPRGFTGVHDYECTVGLDCLTETFPAHLYAMSAADRWDDSGVGRVRLNFSINQAFEQVVLQLARAGEETTVVKVDDKDEVYLVTNSMLGSGENSHYGSYDLSLGPLEMGSHLIEMTVAEDGKANCRYGWDAIVLVVK